MPRRPLPTAILDATGGYAKDPAKRARSRPNEPIPPRGVPDMPDIVASCEIASNRWLETCDVLAEMKVLSKADKDVLTMYCLNWAAWQKLSKQVAECGVLNGDGRSSAAAVNLHKFAEMSRKLMCEMGLTPSARTKVSAVQEKESENPMAALIEKMARG